MIAERAGGQEEWEMIHSAGFTAICGCKMLCDRQASSGCPSLPPAMLWHAVGVCWRLRLRFSVRRR